jgi:hypothetical protein
VFYGYTIIMRGLVVASTFFRAWGVPYLSSRGSGDSDEVDARLLAVLFEAPIPQLLFPWETTIFLAIIASLRILHRIASFGKCLQS